MNSSITLALAQGRIPCSWDIENFQEAEDCAKALTKSTGKLHIAYDEGPGTSPQYGVFEMFQLSDPVSYAFNGDSYPSGHILSITTSLRKITVADGDSIKIFWRRSRSRAWIMNGTWILCKGHHSSYNRSF